MSKRIDADNYVIKKYGNDIKFIRESGGIYYGSIAKLEKIN
ncbi:hypothetical protein [Staphylococcus simulans]|nr:hypothetical protein [Staphylococcus simulans]